MMPDLPAGAGVLGVGLDVVEIDRFARSLARTPTLADRLFTASERLTPTGQPRGPASLAARFAAKESVAKALSVPRGLNWHDCEVISATGGAPSLLIRGTVAAAAAQRGVVGWSLSLSHDAGIAAAVVLALG